MSRELYKHPFLWAQLHIQTVDFFNLLSAGLMFTKVSLFFNPVAEIICELYRLFPGLRLIRNTDTWSLAESQAEKLAASTFLPAWRRHVLCDINQSRNTA